MDYPDFPGYIYDCGMLRRMTDEERCGLATIPAAAPARRASAFAPSAPALEQSVYGIEVAGRYPLPRNIAAIRAAVAGIPAHLLHRWLAAGGKLELVYGTSARVHPQSDSTRPACGFTKFHSAFSVAAADYPEAPLTGLHEVAHGLDFALSYPAHSTEWIRIWRDDLIAGIVPEHARQRDFAAEYFAESCATVWSGDGRGLSEAARSFIEQL